MEPVEPSQMNIYQSNTYRKDLSWLHFNNEPKFQKRQQMKGQQSYISIFIAYLTFKIAARSTISDMTTVLQRQNKAKYLTQNSRRLMFVKKTSMPNPVKSLGFIMCYRLSTPGLLKALAILSDRTVRRSAFD